MLDKVNNLSIKNKISNEIKEKFKININNKDLMNIIENQKSYKKRDFEKLDNENLIKDLYIEFWIYALDTGNSNLLISLLKYNRKYLTPNNFKYILERKNETFKNEVSTLLINNLIDKKEIELLNILYNYSSAQQIVNHKQITYLQHIQIKKYLDENEAILIKNSSLINACKNNNEILVKNLVRKGADVNYIDKDDNRPLLIACEYECYNIVKYLVKHGADVNQKDIHNFTPLYYVYLNKNSKMIKYLIEHGADINQNFKNGNTVLTFACENNDENFIKYLIEHGIDVNKKDSYDDTPLIIACKKNNEKIVRLLVEHGANINQKDKYGNTPLYFACKKENINIVDYFIKHEVEIDENIYDVASKNKKIFDNLIRYSYIKLA